MERDYIFKEIDRQLLQMQDYENNIQGMISSFSNQRFLGFCCLAQNRILEMTDQERQRASFLINALGLEKIYFGIFSMCYINMPNQKPEKDQNYDTSHIVRFQYRMNELTLKRTTKTKVELVINPIKLNVLNLVDTQNIDNSVTMANYSFVNQNMISQMDMIGEKVKQEIIQMTRNREIYFAELRKNEKDYALLTEKNARLRQRLKDLQKELNELMSQNQI